MTSNAVPPSVTPPSPLEWPQNLILFITGITKDSQAHITSPSHGFTTQDEGQTFITIKQVQGMIQINGITCLIDQIIDTNNFSVNVNSTTFSTYTSGGVFIVDTGRPPVEQTGFQYYNTPFQNIGTIY